MRSLLLALVVVLVAAFGSAARADEVAPELEAADLRSKAHAELRRLVAAMPPNDQRRLAGIDVAFDDDATDPLAQVACDDDGDYVIVLSNAMLRLSAHIASASLYDDGGANRKIEEYAAFVARSQVPGRRLLPPPPGFYVAETRPTAGARAGAYEDSLGDVLSFIVARELVHLRAGDLTCPNPTATKENGDDLWTAAERRKAGEIARGVYPGRQAERDNEATVSLLEVGHTERGAVLLLRLFEAFELERRVSLGRFLPTYATHHPGAATRLAVVRHAAITFRNARGREDDRPTARSPRRAEGT